MGRASAGRATFWLAAVVVIGSGCGAPGAAMPPGEPEAQLVVKEACRADAECTIGRPAPCSFCGGCDQAMTQAEYDDLERQARDCPPLEGVNGSPVACGPCPMGPDRAACVNGECVGIVADAAGPR